MKSFDEWNKEKPFHDIGFEADWLPHMLERAYNAGATNKLIDIAESVFIQSTQLIKDKLSK